MVINGKRLAAKKISTLKKKIAKQKQKPQLDILYIEKNPASDLYIRKKEEVARELGVIVRTHTFGPDVPKQTLESTCRDLALNPNVSGYFIQLPMPKRLPKQELLDCINVKKDVDCLTSTSLGYTMTFAENIIRPATVQAIIDILKSIRLRLRSKKVTIVNDSTLIGKSLAMYFLQKGATVSICNEFTPDLKSFTKDAQILITATGKAGLITKDMIGKDAAIIDAGIARKGSKVVGDTDFGSMKNSVRAITPVPGGVGPVTVACLFENLLKLHEKHQKK